MRQQSVSGPEAAALLFSRHSFVASETPEIARRAGVVFVTYGRERVAAAMFVGRSANPRKHFSFRSAERREKWIDEQVKVAEQAAAHRAERATERASKVADFVNPLKVGDVLEGSWGHEQTNIEFFEVVELYGKRGVGIRALRQHVTSAAGYMAEYVKPASGAGRFHPADAVIERNRGVLRKVVGLDGSIKLFDFGCWLRKWDGRERYQSHYA